MSGNTRVEGYFWSQKTTSLSHSPRGVGGADKCFTECFACAPAQPCLLTAEVCPLLYCVSSKMQALAEAPRGPCPVECLDFPRGFPAGVFLRSTGCQWEAARKSLMS